MLTDGAMVFVRIGDERAAVYCEGGIGFSCRVEGVGFVVCDEPSRLIVRAAVAVRAAVFPQLAERTEADILD